MARAAIMFARIAQVQPAMRRRFGKQAAVRPAGSSREGSRPTPLDTGLELGRPDHAYLETEIAQGGTQVVVNGDGLSIAKACGESAASAAFDYGVR